MIHLKEVIRRYEQSGGTLETVDCNDVSLVDQVEESLQLQFPEGVKAFYRVYEYIAVGIYEFIWFRNLPILLPRIHSRYLEIPKNYLPVLDDEVGGYYYVVCAEKGEPKPSDFGTVIYNPGGAHEVMEFCSFNFLDFVISKIEEQLEALD